MATCNDIGRTADLYASFWFFGFVVITLIDNRSSRLADEHRLAELCISWLSRAANSTHSDFDAQLKADFKLVLAEVEFDLLTRDGE